MGSGCGITLYFAAVDTEGVADRCGAVRNATHERKRTEDANNERNNQQRIHLLHQRPMRVN